MTSFHQFTNYMGNIKVSTRIQTKIPNFKFKSPDMDKDLYV